MTSDTTGEGELLEELLHSLRILSLIWVDFRVDTFKVRLRNDTGGAVSRTRNEKYIQVVFLDETVHVNPSERLASI